MSERIPGFPGEYLWEFDIAERQLGALAEAFPPERYGWRPAPTARSVSEILVHVAAGNFMLLAFTGVEAAPDLYGKLEDDMRSRFQAIVARNDDMEKTVTGKNAVVALLKRSLEAVRTAFGRASESELERSVKFLFEQTTVRRVYLRSLAHMHEHMGQLTAYTRAMELPAPWPDWRDAARKKPERGETA